MITITLTDKQAHDLYWKLPKSKGIRIAVWDKDPTEENDDD